MNLRNTLLSIVLLGFLFYSPLIFAQAQYQPLVGNIPGLVESTASSNIPQWLARMYQFLIGIAGVLAVLMIFWAGFQFVVSGDNAGKRSAARGRILAALGGLLLALSSYIILNTINPQLVQINLNFDEIATPDQVGGSTPSRSTPQANAGEPSRDDFFGTIGDSSGFVRHDDYNNPLWNYYHGSTQINPYGNTTTPNQGANTIINPSQNQTPPTISSDKTESAVREYFRNHGIAINNGPCSGAQTTGCTNVQGLGDRALTGVVYIKNRSGAPVTITGGTEPGHQTHGIGKSIVDLRLESTLNNWIISNAVRSYQRGRWTEYQHANGTKFMYEDDHWHVEF